ncbi:MAG: deoxyribodipyrimidine photo-lyase [Candidatus Methanospirareceae archaeon]
MNPNRLRLLKGGEWKRKRPVVYWMSRDQRVHDNWALLFSQELAIRHKAPLVVLFCMIPHFLGATMRQYRFMLTGLQEVEKRLAADNIPLVVITGSPEVAIPNFVSSNDVGVLVSDFTPIRINRNWKAGIAEKIDCPFYEVDAHNIVPCWLASPKQEFAARTLRPKITRAVPAFLEGFPPLRRHPDKWHESRNTVDWAYAVRSLRVDEQVPAVNWLKLGEKAAYQVLRQFLEYKLESYPERRNDPGKDVLSNLSPYLHFGQIGAQRVVLEVNQSEASPHARDAFMEELIVRRELAENYCYYNRAYDSLDGLPAWARETLQKHVEDPREYLYTRTELEQAKTHDRYWNAAQMEMVLSGKMHGYMRMYWGKKILEWSSMPDAAFTTALFLNDRYELDGRDPNGVTGVAWCFGTHDRPWWERAIFGKVRYMNAAGLKRKFDMDAYVTKVDTLSDHA